MKDIIQNNSKENFNRTAVTIGKFDSFHLGHQLLLKDIIKVSKDKKLQPLILKLSIIKEGIMSKKEEEEFLMQSYPSICRMDYIDFTPEFMALSPEEFVKEILVDKYNVGHVSVGKDFRFGKDRSGDSDTLKKLGQAYDISVNIIDKLKLENVIISSSCIRSSLEKGDVKYASMLMGRDYLISGLVEGGKKLGRNLGYPTINLGTGSGKLLPRYGVYASRVIIDNKEYRGITNIGIRPSIDDGNMPSVETFIYNFSDDIYGRKVDIIPVLFIRDEEHFDSLKELTDQISRDIKYAIDHTE
ncbi:MAG: bifunctional riboflavin kinase/FAD synthetase [Eubacterium sp.]|nr:bifunctional riboflavin kinase/FAD synthetase [Eubacterium sp.]